MNQQPTLTAGTYLKLRRVPEVRTNALLERFCRTAQTFLLTPFPYFDNLEKSTGIYENLPLYQRLKMSFIERELTRIKAALVNQNEGLQYDKLYAAQQALEWVIEPNGIKSPYAMIMDIQEGLTDYSVEPHLPQSLDICDHCELRQ